MGPTYRIGELAAASGLTPDTLRYYERLQLLPRPPRTAGGFRVYGPAALERLRFISQARTLGLSLREIGALLSYADRGGFRRCRRVHDLLQQKMDVLDRRLAELQDLRRTLRRYLEACEQALSQDRDECPVIARLGIEPHRL